ncbi:monovalent cation/H(+) antiporter subunit G [Desulfatitalea alkaliphila]|uniref:Monovalent cation/H(+) antiporter subunit G n=1 Tax=Desulfatitalea alkaliphila TaxID=2929485 RepID=A0AA41RD49_9BACT|nr:monovalent cation/H(+) antiporter subunit G [Desulfatitalea alkaliphila]MCJ8502658.1 monovalent cation/H(+) antiporter subunit G [Desulfatitalea alkaliphila]
MSEYIAGILIWVGSGFCFVAALGIVRLPDTLTRMHAATKAGTLGAGLLIIGGAVFFQELLVTLRALTIIALVVLTAPVAAHLIGRASYESGVPLSDRTWIDELEAYENEKRASEQYCQPGEW